MTRSRARQIQAQLRYLYLHAEKAEQEGDAPVPHQVLVAARTLDNLFLQELHRARVRFDWDRHLTLVRGIVGPWPGKPPKVYRGRKVGYR